MDLKPHNVQVLKKDEKTKSSSDSNSQAVVQQNPDGVKLGNTAKTVKKNGQEKSRGKNNRKIRVQKSKVEKKSTREINNLFVFEDISNNKEASSLIHDLINCFTCNSTLPQAELDTLHATLYDRSSSDCFKKLHPKDNVTKKDVCCQTSVTGDIISSVTFKEESDC